MGRTHISRDAVRVTIRKPGDLEHVKAAARCAKRHQTSLFVHVLYRRPSIGTIMKWRLAAPQELRAHIHGATAAESLARTALQAAISEDVVPEEVTCLEEGSNGAKFA